MDRLVAARKLIAELVKAEQIEVRRAEIVGRDLAQLVETRGHPPSGDELETWLDEHAQVNELYASATLLDELVFRYLTPPPPTDAIAEARHPELEQRLRAEPDNTDLYLVYADWLQDHGDPLGELIAFAVAKDETRFERHLKLHESRFLGSCVAHKNQLEWRNGMVRAIEGASLTPAAWRQLLALRVCELLESITLVGNISFSVDDAIIANAPPTLRKLEFASWLGALPEKLLELELTSLAITSTWSVTFRTLPASLQQLRLRVYDFEQSDPIAWNVRELDFGANARVGPRLYGAQLANLERLVIADRAPSIDLAKLLDTMALPALRHLTIDGGVLSGETVAAVAELPLASNLTSLALTDLGLDDDTIAPIVRACRSLPALREIDISENELSRDGLAIVGQLSATVISRRQHKRGSMTERKIRRFAGTRMRVAEEIAEPKAWRRAGQHGGVRWAKYRGDTEYELFVSADLESYGCTCPSSYQPCKHVVALALIAERKGLPNASDEALVNRVRARDGIVNDD